MKYVIQIEDGRYINKQGKPVENIDEAERFDNKDVAFDCYAICSLTRKYGFPEIVEVEE